MLGYLSGPTFNSLPSSDVTGLLTMKEPSFPKMSGTNHPMLQCNISEIWKPHFVQVQNRRNNIFLKCRGDGPIIAECSWSVTEVSWESQDGKAFLQPSPLTTKVRTSKGDTFYPWYVIKWISFPNSSTWYSLHMPLFTLIVIKQLWMKVNL